MAGGAGWNARRTRCALPDCSDGKQVFPTLGAGMEHVWKAHGIKTPYSRQTACLVPLDPRRTTMGQHRGHSKDFAPSPEEYRRLLNAARDDLDRLIFLVLGEAGLRKTELLHLRSSWLRDGHLHIPYQDPTTGWKGKTPQAARTIPLRDMSPETWEVLEDWFGHARKVEQLGPSRRRWGGIARRTRWGHRRTRTPLGVCDGTIWRRVRNGGIRAEIPTKLFPHALRAFCATTWAYRLGNPFTLQVLMGWATSEMAVRYVASAGRPLEEAVDAWNRGANNGGPPPAPCIHDSTGGNNGGSVPYAGSPRLT